MRFYTYPRADDYNDAWDRIVPRMTSIRTRLTRALSDQQRYANLQLADRQAIEDSVRQGFAQLALEDAQSGSFREVVVENFSQALDGLNVDVQGGYATLPISSREDIPLGDPTVLWGQSSRDGLPGNWAETQSTTKDADLRDQAVVVFGNDVTSALVDQDSSTHFEYERCVVDPDQKTAVYDTRNGNVSGDVQKHVLDIISPDTWQVSIPERGDRMMVAAVGQPNQLRGTQTVSSNHRGEIFSAPLRLALRIPIKDSSMIATQLVVTPYSPANQVGKASFKLAEATAVGAQGRTLLKKTFTMDRPRSLRVPDTALDYVELVFVQEKAYRTTLAHRYYEEKLVHKQSGKALFGLINLGKADRYEWKRVADPNQLLGVVKTSKGSLLQNIGLGLSDVATGVGSLMAGIGGTNTGTATAPKVSPLGALGSTISAAGVGFGMVWKGLFGQTTKTTERIAVRDGWDIFTGERYGIGLADVQLSQVTYANTGTAVLGPFVFSQAVQYLSVHATYQLPDDIPDGNWVTFEYSSDQTTWVPIKIDEVVNYTSDKVWLRVQISRPAEALHSTPLLHEVRVYAS